MVLDFLFPCYKKRNFFQYSHIKNVNFNRYVSFAMEKAKRNLITLISTKVSLTRLFPFYFAFYFVYLVYNLAVIIFKELKILKRTHLNKRRWFNLYSPENTVCFKDVYKFHCYIPWGIKDVKKAKWNDNVIVLTLKPIIVIYHWLHCCFLFSVRTSLFEFIFKIFLLFFFSCE